MSDDSEILTKNTLFLAVTRPALPCEQGPVIKRRGMVAIDIGHEFGGAGLSCAGAPLVGGEAQVPRQRRLDACTIENFALDGGAFDNLLRDKLDGQAVALIGIEVVERADDDARTFQELLFRRADAVRVETEIRPVGKLPIPAHDR